jgi:GNAT superfamily N-acetyltransferase
MPWSLRPAVPDDTEQLAVTVTEGFEGYRAFAPPGWRPPEEDGRPDRLRERLASDGVWCLVAEEDGEMAGHVSFLPARIHPHPSDDPAMAHLWQLFVRRRWWGTGLAAELLSEAVREAGARGFSSMRLFTPAAQARARRFYEREGWTPAGAPFDDPDFGMPLVEYRRAISSSV